MLKKKHLDTVVQSMSFLKYSGEFLSSFALKNLYKKGDYFHLGSIRFFVENFRIPPVLRPLQLEKIYF